MALDMPVGAEIPVVVPIKAGIDPQGPEQLVGQPGFDRPDRLIDQLDGELLEGTPLQHVERETKDEGESIGGRIDVVDPRDVQAGERLIAGRADGEVGSRDPSILELVAIRGPELDLPQLCGEGYSGRGQDGVGIAGIEILEACASRDRQFVAGVLPERGGQAKARLEYP